MQVFRVTQTNLKVGNLVWVAAGARSRTGLSLLCGGSLRSKKLGAFLGSKKSRGVLRQAQGVLREAQQYLRMLGSGPLKDSSGMRTEA